MSMRAMLGRLAAMDREELRFRVTCESRKIAGRLRFGMARPRWDRRDLAGLLDPGAGGLVREARDRASRGDALGAHRALARHFSSRAPRWPIAAGRRNTLVSEVRQRFPMAAAAARDRADAIVAGRYDLLGFRGLAVGATPDWHRDIVHERSAPRGYWASVPFLDPASGDHKIIWEINRHQHFLALGEAWWMTGEDVYRQTFITQLEDWVAANPPLDGINWASMLELAFRALSWTWAVEFFSEGAERDETPWLVDLLIALDRQLTHVEQNLSTYFSPNTHLSGEALALYAVSQAFPELTRSRARGARARDVLIREAAVQISSDGGHAELSAHYHRYTTDFYLLATVVGRLTDDPSAPFFESTLRKLAAYLRTIADARGRLPNIGDDDGGQLFRFGELQPGDASSTLAAAASVLDDASLAVAPAAPEVAWTLGELPRAGVAAGGATAWPSRLLAQSGYFVSRRDDRGHHVIFDGGSHGFLNGGHAHADALSIAITVGHEPLLVDPGTATYTMDPAMRDRLRAPEMHNTLVVDGVPFASPRGPFHWQRTANARFLATDTGPDVEFAVARHDGYGFPVSRALVTLGARGWLIVDHVAAPRDVRVEAWWHLHPRWSASPSDAGFALQHLNGTRLALATSADDRTMEMQPFSPEYGRLDHAVALRTAIEGSGPAVMATYIPAAIGAMASRVEVVGVDRLAQPGWTMCFVLIEADPTLFVSIAFPEQALPDGVVWPQPCIQEARAVCVE